MKQTLPFEIALDNRAPTRAQGVFGVERLPLVWKPEAWA
jgi:hypothetical protein